MNNSLQKFHIDAVSRKVVSPVLVILGFFFLLSALITGPLSYSCSSPLSGGCGNAAESVLIGNIALFTAGLVLVGIGTFGILYGWLKNAGAGLK